MLVRSLRGVFRDISCDDIPLTTNAFAIGLTGAGISTIGIERMIVVDDLFPIDIWIDL